MKLYKMIPIRRRLVSVVALSRKMAASSAGRYFLLWMLLIQACKAQPLLDDNGALFFIGGLASDQEHETPFTLVGNTVCSSLPPLPSKRRAGFMAMVNGSMIYCGGRQSLLQINSDCWKFQEDGKTWKMSTPLPRALAGAAAIGHLGKLWAFGGVVEEDFYENNDDVIDYYQAKNQHEYYDYVIEETGNDIFIYDQTKDTWSNKHQLPLPLQGSCAVEYRDRILLLGGKNEVEFISGSNEVWQFNPSDQTWSFIWPAMLSEHFYHGCTVFTNEDKQPIVAVGGGQGPSTGGGHKVEILVLPTKDDFDKASSSSSLEGIVKWEPLPDTNFPHAFNPAIAFVNGFLYIAGGGDFALSVATDKVERFQDGKWWSFGHAPTRAFGSSLTIPSAWLDGCHLEPNLGLHDYYQRKTKEKLKSKKWLCFNDQLLVSDQDRKLGSGEEFMEEGCTVPGCHFPHFFRQINGGKTRSSAISCQVEALGQPRYHVECQLSCRPGLTPMNGVNATFCNRDTSLQDKRAKLTNFTQDYLECQRDPSLIRRVLGFEDFFLE